MECRTELNALSGSQAGSSACTVRNRLAKAAVSAFDELSYPLEATPFGVYMLR